MEAKTPHVSGRFWIGENGADTPVDEIAVVIPADNPPVGQPFPTHCRPEEVLDEIALILSGEDARLPCLRRHRLIRNRDRPDGMPSRSYVLMNFV
jgi:hypothetical protein